MGRRPRTDLERASRFATKLNPATIADTLDARLPSMQSAAADWFNRQAALYSVINGVLSGFAIPSFQYARYYAFGLQIDKQARRFGYSPAAQQAVAQIEATWISRGYDVIILDAIKSSVITWDTTWSIDPGAYPQFLSVNQTNGNLAFGEIVDKKLHILNYVTRALTSANLTTANAAISAWCAELNQVCLCETDSSDCIARVDAATLAVTEFPLTAGDNPEDVVVDYAKGVAWVCCSGHGKLYGMPLVGAAAPLAITIAHVCNHIVLDITHNCVWLSGKGNSTIYAVDRDTHAVTSYAGSHTMDRLSLDETHNVLWIGSETGSAFVSKFNTGTHAFTYFTVSDNNPTVAADPLRHKCYVQQFTPGNILVIDGSAGTTTTIATSTDMQALMLDPTGSHLIWTNQVAGTVTRVNLVSLLSQTIAIPNTYDISCYFPGHIFFIAQYVPGVSKAIVALMP
jgi:streptogramin lyase